MHANTLSLVAIWGIVLTTRGPVHSQPVETSVYTIREEDVVYRAAVLEYRAYDDMAEGGLAVLRENARVFVEYAEAARQQGADIIVFPEYGLTGSTSRSLADFMSKTQALPDPGTGTVLCNSTDTSESIEAVRVLSCTAAELGMYLVVNLAEQVPCEPQMNPRGHLQGSALESTRGIGEEPLGGGGGGGRGGERDSEEGEDEEHKDLRGEETDPGEGGRKEPNQKVNIDPKHREGKRDLGEGDETRDPEGGDGGGAPRECLDSGFYVFNTEVVFDRAGVVVAKYHKKSLYLEPGFTPGSQDDKEAIFTTDFGVTFSLQVCFDILYGGPGTSNVVERGVTDVIMSSYWVDELPFLAAPQMWQSWSEGLAVNLMVANFHNPEEGALGSGIFRGLTSQESLYTYDPNSGTKLLVGEVVSRRTTPLPAPTGHGDDAATPEGTTGVGSDGTLIQSSSQAVPVRKEITMGIHQEASWIPTDNGDVETEEKKGQPEAEGREISTDRVFLHEDLEQYSNFALERGDGVMERSLCHNDSLCCSVTYSFPADPTDESSFLLLAYSGVAEKGDGAYLLFTQVCAIVYCLNENVTSCALIEENEAPQKTSFRAHNITGDFDTSYIYPSVFTQELKLVDTSLWDFESSVSSEKMVKSTLVLHEDVDYLLSLTLFGRWFDRDP